MKQREIERLKELDIKASNCEPLTSEEIEDAISDNIVNLVEEAVSNISRTRSNRRNHSSISLT